MEGILFFIFPPLSSSSFFFFFWVGGVLCGKRKVGKRLITLIFYAFVNSGNHD
jgi:hypothetical protein